MSSVEPKLSAPLFSPESAVLFSAYEFGWGYCAFELPAETICEDLGAAGDSRKQLLLAFRLGKQKILHAVVNKADSHTGARLPLGHADFQADTGSAPSSEEAERN